MIKWHQLECPELQATGLL